MLRTKLVTTLAVSMLLIGGCSIKGGGPLVIPSTSVQCSDPATCPVNVVIPPLPTPPSTTTPDCSLVVTPSGRALNFGEPWTVTSSVTGVGTGTLTACFGGSNSINGGPFVDIGTDCANEGPMTQSLTANTAGVFKRFVTVKLNGNKVCSSSATPITITINPAPPASSKPTLTATGTGGADNKSIWITGQGFIAGQTTIDIRYDVNGAVVDQIAATNLAFPANGVMTFDLTALGKTTTIEHLEKNGGIYLSVVNPGSGNFSYPLGFVKSPSVEMNEDGTPHVGTTTEYPCALWLVGYNLENAYAAFRKVSTSSNTIPDDYVLDSDIDRQIQIFPKPSALSFYIPPSLRASYRVSGLKMTLYDAKSGSQAVEVTIPADPQCPAP